VILDTDGNIFGGFTPVEWESRYSDCGKADPSLKSFLFTLKSPDNIVTLDPVTFKLTTAPRKVRPRRFPLMAKARKHAIQCDSNDGPNFNDLYVSDNCNANTRSFSNLGSHSYPNDTEFNGETVFTGSLHFQVKEIEVFEIKD
jgi:hypothetical protein